MKPYAFGFAVSNSGKAALEVSADILPKTFSFYRDMFSIFVTLLKVPTAFSNSTLAFWRNETVTKSRYFRKYYPFTIFFDKVESILTGLYFFDWSSKTILHFLYKSVMDNLKELGNFAYLNVPLMFYKNSL